MQTKRLQGIITFIRHGEKSHDGSLTSKGELQVLAKSISTKYLGGEIIVFHSGVDRVKRTVDIVRNFLMFTEDDLLSHSLQELLETQQPQPITPAAQLHSLHFLEDSSLPSTYYTTWDDRVKSDQQSTLSEFLQMKNNSPEPGTVIPPKSLAQRVCQLILEQITMVESSPKPMNIINGTHEPVLLALVSYLINEGKDPEFDFLDKLGGSIRFAETADIEIYQSNLQIEYSFRFRNFCVSFTPEDLITFVKS